MKLTPKIIIYSDRIKVHGTTKISVLNYMARTDQYNIMCSLVSHDMLQTDYKDDESSIGDRAIPNNAAVTELKSLGATFNFIDIWLKLLRKNYCARSESYSIAMEQMFKKIPQNVEKALTSSEENQKLMTDIGGGWYLKNVLGEYHH